MKIIYNSGVINTDHITRLCGNYNIIINDATTRCVNGGYLPEIKYESDKCSYGKVICKCDTEEQAKEIVDTILNAESDSECKILDVRKLLKEKTKKEEVSI